MSRRAIARKVLVFGVLGAVGCLAGWAAGEGLWHLPLTKAETATMGSIAESVKDPPKLPLPPKLPDPPRPLTLDPPPAVPPAEMPPEIKKRVKDEGGQSGPVEISLHWYNFNDLDLHCIDPQNAEICFRHYCKHGDNQIAPSGGQLDVDMNCGGKSGGHSSEDPIENIVWRTTPPPGHYRVDVYHFAKWQGTDPTEYELYVLANGRNLGNTTDGKGNTCFRGSISAGERPRSVCEFDVAPPIPLRMSLPPELVVNQGGANEMKLRIARDNYKGNVVVEFSGDLDGLTFRDSLKTDRKVVIPEDKDEVTLAVIAKDDALGGTHEIGVTASNEAGTACTKGHIPVRVNAIPPSLQLSAPAEVHVNQGADIPMKVLVGRNHFTGPVTVRFSGGSEGITLPEVTIPAERTEQEVKVAARSDAPEGQQTVQIIAGSGGTPPVKATPVDLKVIVDKGFVVAKMQWSWPIVLATGLWTGLLAAGLALALVMGQNRYLGRPLLSRRQFAVVSAGGLAAGLVAGGIGQILSGLLTAFQLLPAFGAMAGWLLLGGMLGWGIGLFVPNLNAGRAAIAGIIGGFLGAMPFLPFFPFGDLVARLVAAGILGFCIGLMVALVEVAFREAWLDVQFGPVESRQVNLGMQPVTFGSDHGRCTVFVRDIAPLAVSYWLEGERVYREETATAARQEVQAGEAFTIGNASVVVCTARKPNAGDRRMTIAPPPPPHKGSRKAIGPTIATPVPKPVSRPFPKPSQPSPPPPLPVALPPATPPATLSGSFPQAHPRIPPPPPPPPRPRRST